MIRARSKVLLVVDERESRIGLNEAMLRRVNEAIEGINESFAQITNRFAIFCECGNLACEEQISIAPAQYDALREQSELFAVVPGHAVADVEEVVEKRPGYDVVRKRAGGPAELARVTDPNH